MAKLSLKFPSKLRDLGITLMILSLITSQTLQTGQDQGKVVQEDDEEDFNLDIIDVNNPKAVQNLIDTHFPKDDENAKISKDQMLSMLYSFILNHSKTTIDILHKKHAEGRNLKHREEDLLSNAHSVQEHLKRQMEKRGIEEFDREQARALLNKEEYHDFLHVYVDEVLEDIMKKRGEAGYNDDVAHAGEL